VKEDTAPAPHGNYSGADLPAAAAAALATVSQLNDSQVNPEAVRPAGAGAEARARTDSELQGWTWTIEPQRLGFVIQLPQQIDIICLMLSIHGGFSTAATHGTADLWLRSDTA